MVKHSPAAAEKPPVLEHGEVRRNTTLYLTIILILPFLSHFLGSYVLDIARSFAPPTVAAFLLANTWIATGLTYFAFLGFTLFYLQMTLEPLSSYGLRWSREYFGAALLIGLASGVLMFLVDSVFLGTYTLPPPSVLGVIGGVLTIGLLPALFEETLFRGVIQRFYARVTEKTLRVWRWQVPRAVFIASGFEVLFHLSFPLYFNFFGGFGAAFVGTIPQLCYVAVFGAIGGYLYSRTGSLVAPITIHIVGNLTELLLLWTLAN